MSVCDQATKPIPRNAWVLSCVTLCLAIFTTNAHAEEPMKVLLAQCTIDAYSDTGRHFLKENNSSHDRDSSYRNWMLICMEAKGYAYNIQKCPPATNGKADFSNYLCYKKM